MNAFYPAFSPACFSLLGLWLIVVQIRLERWQKSPDYRSYQKASYGIALQFALPGLMSLLALVNQDDPHYWRASFAIISLGGALVLGLLRGPVRGPRGTFAYVGAIAGYLAAFGLSLHGGAGGLRTEEILLTALVFVDFNAAWLLLFEEGEGAPGPARDGEGEADDDASRTDVLLLATEVTEPPGHSG